MGGICKSASNQSKSKPNPEIIKEKPIQNSEQIPPSENPIPNPPNTPPPEIPTLNESIKLSDSQHNSFLFVGHDTIDSDHTVYSSKREHFYKENFHPRTSLMIIPHEKEEGFHQIYDHKYNSFFYTGNGMDKEGYHTIYSCPQDYWKEHKDFLYRTSFSIEKLKSGGWRIQDTNHKSYLFVGDDTTDNDYTIRSVNKMDDLSNKSEWEVIFIKKINLRLTLRKNESNENTVYSCKRTGCSTENFEKRTKFMITPSDDNKNYIIKDLDYNTCLYLSDVNTISSDSSLSIRYFLRN